MVRTYFNLIIPNERQETIMMTKLKQKLHGNSIVKRTVTVTPQDNDTIKKVIETFFSSGRITTEEIQIFSIKRTYYTE